MRYRVVNRQAILLVIRRVFLVAYRRCGRVASPRSGRVPFLLGYRVRGPHRFLVLVRAVFLQENQAVYR